MSAPLVEARGLVRTFATHGRRDGAQKLFAVRGVDLHIMRGETVGLVGESGCGKSTLGRALLRLMRPTAGRVLFDGVDITHASSRALRPLRRRMQIVFQDPVTALNPRLRVADALAEPIAVHQLLPASAIAARLEALVDSVGLDRDTLTRFPHELSGGQRQRVGLARALSVEPEFIVADEPVSALDVSVQAQVLSLFVDLKRSLELTYLFISHDLRVVRYLSDRLAVMYLGRIVELGPSPAVFSAPAHPYTATLLAATPGVGRNGSNAAADDPGSAVHLPKGCSFHPRCSKAVARCAEEDPALARKACGHDVACHLA